MASQVLNSELLARLVRGQPALLSFAIPIIRTLRRERRNTGGTDEAEYCYSVFIRHVKAGAYRSPKTVMEFGPGDSIGIGLCWLIAGADAYYAMDAHPYADVERSLAILDDLVELFRTRAEPLADPEIKPRLSDLRYPEVLDAADLTDERIDAIRAAVRHMHHSRAGPNPQVTIRYWAPWSSESDVPAASVDLAYSQAVLEHVVDIEGAYAAMARWVRPGGLLSHQIDLRCHNTALDWNGHWAYSPTQWARANNKQTYRAINRVSCSGHLERIERSGFEIVNVLKAETKKGLSRRHVARGLNITDEDLTCSGLYVLARRSA